MPGSICALITSSTFSFFQIERSLNTGHSNDHKMQLNKNFCRFSILEAAMAFSTFSTALQSARPIIRGASPERGLNIFWRF